MSSTTSICAEGDLVVHVFLDPQFIFETVLCSPRHSVSPLWFHHSLIEVNSDKDFGSTLEAFAVMDMLA